jgi:CheY-like chemotaxis protein
MSGEMLEHLFLPFERTMDREGYLPSGLGIGLTISQNLMQAQGGSIEAKSAGPSLGSTFTVRIPALAANPATPGNRGTDEANGDSHTPLYILLVEDHEDSAMVIARIVRNMGHSVEISHTVANTLVLLRGQKFDLVLSDIGLPDGTGIDLLTQAREFCSTPMIALTGYGMEDDLARYREAGFLHQLTKPIRFEQLEKLLRDFASSIDLRVGLTVHKPPAA